jgi:hypothetical protein
MAAGLEWLHGTDSKAWKVAQSPGRADHHAQQPDSQTREALRFFANGTYVMALNKRPVTGKYLVDPATKTITMTPNESTASLSFAMEWLTDKQLVLKSADGARLRLEAE